MNRYLNIDIRELKRRNSYWTAREICQQPRVWREAHARIDASRDMIDRWLAPVLSTPNPANPAVRGWYVGLHRRYRRGMVEKGMSNSFSRLLCLGEYDWIDGRSRAVSFARRSDVDDLVRPIR